MFDPYEQLDLNDEACAPPHLNLRIGDKYLIQKLVGSGSSSRVYSAKVYPGTELVAVKILRKGNSTRIGERKLALEGSTLIEISEHKNFVSVYDFGKTEKNEPFLVLELLSGQTLKQVLKDYGKFPLDKALDIGMEILDALAHLHKYGIVHSSFKPADIMLVDFQNKPVPEVILLDLDSVFHPQEPTLYNAELPSEGTTYNYLSPEEAQSKTIDKRADIYVFALILYEMITGRIPFEGNNQLQILEAKLASKVVPFSKALAELPRQSEVESILTSCLNCDPSKRPQSVEELRDRLTALRKRTPTTKEFEVDIKNWDKLPRSAYAEADKTKDDWMTKLKKFMGS